MTSSVVYMSDKESKQLETERRTTRQLIHDAKESALEGARVAERLRLATDQYRERLGLPKKGPDR